MCDLALEMFYYVCVFSCVLSQASLCVKIYYYDFGVQKMSRVGAEKEQEKAGCTRMERLVGTIKHCIECMVTKIVTELSN